MSRLFNSAAFKIFQFDVCSLAKHLKASETLVNRNYCNRGKEYVTLELPQGRIRGYKAQGLYGDCYCGFEGIPYAEPPLGRLRFLSPVPVKKWSGLKDCVDFANKPVQKNEWGMIEERVCFLYINRKNFQIRPIKKLPVLVCIPGGGFVKGGCPKEYVFGPDYFMMEEVILVTFNYRLSMFGFLSLCDPAAKVPGNAGLKDQVLALKWVRANIELFGGDERNICVFGESAGGASVHYMLSTEHTQNVFQKAICQSGSFLHNWTVGYHNIEMSYYLACRKGYKGPRDNDILILKFLQSVPAEKLIDIGDLDLMARYKGYLYAFLPSIEPYECEDTIMSKPVWEIVKNAWGNKIPLIIGGCSFEGLYYYPTLKKLPDFLDHIVKNPVKLLPNDIPTNCEEKEHVERCEELAKTLTKVHFANKIVGRENILPVLDYFSYRLFWHGLHRFVLARMKYAKKTPTYQYVFDFDSKDFNHFRDLFCGGDITEGVAHADDLCYLFYSYFSGRRLDEKSAEFLTIQRMVKIFATFAKTSNPNCEYISNWQDVASAGENKWLNIGNQLEFVDVPKKVQEKFQVWDNLYGQKEYLLKRYLMKI
ncbi:esterase B1-like [Glossina fuscipes fuscipes]